MLLLVAHARAKSMARHAAPDFRRSEASHGESRMLRRFGSVAERIASAGLVTSK
jgi:hypothetical protein